MKKLLTLVCALLLWSCSNGQSKPAENGLINTKLSAKQAELIYNNVKSFPEGTQLSLAIIENGKPQFFGIKRLRDSIVPIENKDSIFEIGSITKVFTATLLSDFVEEGKIKLDTPIQDHLGFQLNSEEEITFRELANHTSGIPRLPSNLDLSTADPTNPYKDYDSEKLKEYLTEEMELSRKPGIQYEYSNLGAGILGFTLTELAESTYESLLQERIFSRNNMANTTNREKVENSLVKGLNPEGEETSNWDFDALAGAGAILSSVNDMSRFAIAQFNEQNKVLALTQQSTFTINDNREIGLGWHILKNGNGGELLWHNGGTGGYTSSIILQTENENAVIILSNLSAFNPQMGKIDQLCFGLMETVINK